MLNPFHPSEVQRILPAELVDDYLGLYERIVLIYYNEEVMHMQECKDLPLMGLTVC